jgi:outer membrane lipoprotein SlyB
MAQDNKSSGTDTQERQAEHIEAGCTKKRLSTRTAKDFPVVCLSGSASGLCKRQSFNSTKYTTPIAVFAQPLRGTICRCELSRNKNNRNRNKNNRKRKNMTQETTEVLHANRDPITGAIGAHPVGTGIGAAAGGAAVGAAIGAVAGPVGTAIGMAAGAIAGGLAGKGVAEKIDPTAEDAYWRTTYSSRSYVDKDTPYDIYQSAYRTGYEGFGRYAGKSYEEVESRSASRLRKDAANLRRG